jgi:Fe-S cluster assembly scaffold protein SufB
MPTFDSTSWWQNHLKHSRTQIESVGWPKAKHEAWLYTPVDRLKRVSSAAGQARPVSAGAGAGASDESLLQKHVRRLVTDFKFTDANQVFVFLNGRPFDLADAFEFANKPQGKNSSTSAQTIKTLCEHTDVTESVRASLSRSPNPNLLGLGWSAFAADRDGVVIQVRENSRLAILHFYTNPNFAKQMVSQNLYEIMPECEVEICELHIDISASESKSINTMQSTSPSDASVAKSENLLQHICDVIVHENAKLSFVQALHMRSSEGVYFINDTRMKVSKSAQLEVLNYSSGTNMARHEYDATLSDTGAQIQLYSLAEGVNKSQTIVSSNIVHAKGETMSDQLAKSLLADESQFVFSGRLEIAEDAQKSDASQYNHNMLLSDKAAAYTRPQLEVFADDVKAAHGATLGSIQEDELFYLQSRALTREQALEMLKEGYANDLLRKLRSQFLVNALTAVRNV